MFAGEKIARIVVPHPALGFPTSLQLTYKSYNGWLSRGIQSWNIYKVVLTDSFGKSYSICKRFFSLESGVPERLDLRPGNCHIPEEVYELDELPSMKQDRVDSGNSADYSNFDDDAEKELKISKNNFGLNEEEHENGSWQNLIEGNGLDRGSTEASRSFHNEKGEIFEPVLKNKKGKEKARNLEGFSNEEIVEPILKSTTQRVSRDSAQQMDRKARENTFSSVQLFPFRLGELLERAERYARMTLLPLISETAPRLFGFGTVLSDESGESERKPKAVDFEDIPVSHSEIEEESAPKNIYESLRETSNKTKVIQSRSIQDLRYYSNINDLTSSDDQSSVDRSDIEIISDDRRPHFLAFSEDMVKIDLPTYRPPARTVKDFPYEFVRPDYPEESTTDTNPPKIVTPPRTSRKDSFEETTFEDDQIQPTTKRFIPLLFNLR